MIILCIDITGIIACISGITVSSSSPSETMTIPSALNLDNTAISSDDIFSSASTPRLYAPAITATSVSYPFVTSSSYIFTAPKIELASASSGSSIANLVPALIH
jgi:hypothetical protein